MKFLVPYMYSNNVNCLINYTPSDLIPHYIIFANGSWYITQCDLPDGASSSINNSSNMVDLNFWIARYVANPSSVLSLPWTSYWLLGGLILTVTGNSRIQQQNICDAKRPRIPSAWGPHSNSGSFVYVYPFINKRATLAISRRAHAPLQWHWMWNQQDFVVEPNDMLCDNQQLQWSFYCRRGYQRRRMAYDVWPLQEYCRVSRASHSALELL